MGLMTKTSGKGRKRHTRDRPWIPKEKTARQLRREAERARARDRKQ